MKVKKFRIDDAATAVFFNGSMIRRLSSTKPRGTKYAKEVIKNLSVLCGPRPRPAKPGQGFAVKNFFQG